MQGLIDFAGSPEVVEEDGELSGHGGDGFLLGDLATAFRPSQSPPPQVTIGTEGAELIMGRLDQEASQHPVAGLGDSALRIALSRLIVLRAETEIGTDGAAGREAMGIYEGQDVGERGDGPHAGHLAEDLGLRIAFGGEALDLTVIAADLESDLFELIQERCKGDLQSGREGLLSWRRGPRRSRWRWRASARSCATRRPGAMSSWSRGRRPTTRWPGRWRAWRRTFVVCGAHMLARPAGRRRARRNGGSVGMPFGEPGAHWLLLDGEVSLGRTEYDVVAAADRIRASAFPGAADLAGRLLRPPSEAEIVAVFKEGWRTERGRFLVDREAAIRCIRRNRRWCSHLTRWPQDA